MSNRLVNLVDQARIGDAYAKAILRKIADQSNDAGSGVWSSHNYLAWIVEIDRTTVARKMKYLYDLGVLSWQSRTGSTNNYGLNVERIEELAEPYRDRVEQMEDIIARAKGVWQDATGVSQEDTGDVADGNTSPLIDQPEPTYIDDVDGVPDEMAMLWDTFRKGWEISYPDKPQARQQNSKLYGKFKTRMKDTEWRNNWKRILWYASQNLPWTHEEGWFKMEWLLRNNDNLFRLTDGSFDFKMRDRQPNAAVAYSKRDTGGNQFLPPRPEV